MMVDTLESFLAALHETIPAMIARVDSPDDPNGETFIDLSCGRFGTEISYRPDSGFGIFISEGAYGQRPDEVYRSASKAAQRIEQLRVSFETGETPTYLSLAEMRQLMELTQERVAETLAIKQPSVQRIEKRGNVEVTTLERFVRAMGGRLEMSVVFDDMEARLELSALRIRDRPRSAKRTASTPPRRRSKVPGTKA